MLHRLFLATAAFAFAATTAFAANPQVELDTSAGVIRIELYPDAAPKTVANFTRLREGQNSTTTRSSIA